MRSDPKHRQLLPLFIGQPIIMCVLVLIAGTLLTLAGGVALSVVDTLRASGVQAFLPSQSTVTAFLFIGLALALVNIACDCVELDQTIAANALEAEINAGKNVPVPRRLSIYAVLLGAAAAVAATVGVRVLLQYTVVHRFHGHPLFAVAEATLVYIVGVHPLLKSYNKNWDFMFRRPKARDPNEVW